MALSTQTRKTQAHGQADAANAARALLTGSVAPLPLPRRSLTEHAWLRATTPKRASQSACAERPAADGLDGGARDEKGPSPAAGNSGARRARAADVGGVHMRSGPKPETETLTPKTK